MCGIVGIHGAQEDGWIVAMNAAQSHRGPDDDGFFKDTDAKLSLAMRRLAILDISGGSQPMMASNGRYVLVYNGEIYNGQQLRGDLEDKGIRFTTDHSDTEVLLHLLVQEGRAALPRLNGMFAFALYDKDAGTVLLARDRMGIKPIYYTAQQGRFAFASELKSLLQLPWISRSINCQSLFHYLSLMHIPAGQSIIERVHRLPAGHLLEYRLKDQSVSIKRWWKLEFEPDNTVPASEWPQRVRASLAKAVSRWCLSDVPVAASLSGGLDSSGIVALARSQGQELQTVSVGFTADGEDAWNELPLAQKVAQRWSTDHHEVVLKPDDLINALPAMVWHLDEPYGGGLPSWSVFGEMSKFVKVGLTGTGGDELFGNYGKWRTLEGGSWRRLLGSAPGENDFRRDYFERWSYYPDRAKRDLLANHADGLEDTAQFLYRRYVNAAAQEVRDRTASVEIATQLSEEFLLMTDRFSMAHSLEARTPFLDNDMVDLVRTIPAHLRSPRGDLKGLLRKALAPLLPEELVNAPKRGFVIPLALWLKGPLKPLAERLMRPDRIKRQGIFEPFGPIGQLNALLGGQDLTTRVWGLLMFQLWHLLVVERKQSSISSLTISDLLDAA